MQHLSTAFLIIALVIAVNGGATAQDDTKADQVADESKNRAVTIIDGPKYVAPPSQPPHEDFNRTRPPVEPPRPPTDRPWPPTDPPRPPTDPPRPPTDPPRPPASPPRPAEPPRPPRPPPPPLRPHSHVLHKGPPPRHRYSKNVKLRHALNSVYRFPRVIPLPAHHRTHYHSKPANRQPLVFAASSGRPVRINKPPKFSVPVETVNGIRADDVRPPKPQPPRPPGASTSTSTSTSTTTQRPLRNKRIWPKGYFDKKDAFPRNTTATDTSESANSTSTNSTDLEIASATHYRFKYVDTNRTAHASTTTFVPLTVTRGYRRVVRVPRHSTTTAAYDVDTEFTRIEPNDWVPIVSPYNPKKHRRAQTPISRRSDAYFSSPEESPEESKRTLYLQSYGLVPVPSAQPEGPVGARKKMVIFRKRKRHLTPHFYSGYSPRQAVRAPAPGLGDLRPEASQPRTVMRIKHHHHHHHHRYIKTVEKPVKVPYRVEVPRPYPVPVEKKVPVAVEKIKIVEKPVPYPVTVEKRVPYPVQVAVPHPVPYKVIEKEYVPKPYPVVQHVPVLKHVEVKVPQPVPVTVEKRVPYPVEVQVPVPVDRPYPVTVEKRVPYPVPVKVLVPQPYAVETKVPYPVEVKVKEPVEVVKHVPVRVPYPQPYPVRVPAPVAVPVEKRVPYPVEVEKKVPVPYKVVVPQKVEVEKKVPVYVPRPYPVEKKVPVPVKVPYPVKVFNDVPVYINPYLQQAYLQNYNEITRQVSGGAPPSAEATSAPSHVVTVHGNTGFAGFQSRSDKTETTSAESADKPESTSAESAEGTSRESPAQSSEAESSRTEALPAASVEASTPPSSSVPTTQQSS